nr:unnamed protein product [Callosobruchus chinensis]
MKLCLEIMDSKIRT